MKYAILTGLLSLTIAGFMKYRGKTPAQDPEPWTAGQLMAPGRPGRVAE